MRRIPPIPSTVVATLTAALALLPLLGRKPLTDWDEAIYAEVSREMLGHSWLIPHWNYQLWLEKPPLMLWITAALFHFFGVSEFWARAASALSGVAIVCILHFWLARTRDTLTAWLSTMLLLGTFGFLHACHTGEMDLLLALGCTIALIGLAQVDAQIDAQVDRSVGHPARADSPELNVSHPDPELVEEEGNPHFTLPPTPNHRSGWLLFWIGFAIAAMTKGAASVTLPLTAVLLAVLQRWRFERLRSSFWLGLALFLALVLPWHLAMFHLYGRDFLYEYFGFHVLLRATRQIEGHATHWWYYFKVLLVSAPPFALIYPVALAYARRCSQTRVFALFALTTLAFFTLVQTRLPQYIVPIYPAFTVLTAVYLVDKLRQFNAAPRLNAIWLKLAIVTISIATILATTPARKALHTAASGIPASDSKDSTALLRDLLKHPQPIPPLSIDGPLLVWNPGRAMSMPSDVFYARRPVAQVQLIPIAPESYDRYTFNPQPTADAITSRPRLILLDRALVPHVPAAFTYTTIESHGAIELGTIAHVP